MARPTLPREDTGSSSPPYPDLLPTKLGDSVELGHLSPAPDSIEDSDQYSAASSPGSAPELLAIGPLTSHLEKVSGSGGHVDTDPPRVQEAGQIPSHTPSSTHPAQPAVIPKLDLSASVPSKESQPPPVSTLQPSPSSLSEPVGPLTRGSTGLDTTTKPFPLSIPPDKATEVGVLASTSDGGCGSCRSLSRRSSDRKLEEPRLALSRSSQGEGPHANGSRGPDSPPIPAHTVGIPRVLESFGTDDGTVSQSRLALSAVRTARVFWAGLGWFGSCVLWTLGDLLFLVVPSATHSAWFTLTLPGLFFSLMGAFLLGWLGLPLIYGLLLFIGFIQVAVRVPQWWVSLGMCRSHPPTLPVPYGPCAAPPPGSPTHFPRWPASILLPPPRAPPFASGYVWLNQVIPWVLQSVLDVPAQTILRNALSGALAELSERGTVSLARAVFPRAYRAGAHPSARLRLNTCVLDRLDPSVHAIYLHTSPDHMVGVLALQVDIRFAGQLGLELAVTGPATAVSSDASSPASAFTASSTTTASPQATSVDPAVPTAKLNLRYGRIRCWLELLIFCKTVPPSQSKISQIIDTVNRVILLHSPVPPPPPDEWPASALASGLRVPAAWIGAADHPAISAQPSSLGSSPYPRSRLARSRSRASPAASRSQRTKVSRASSGRHDDGVAALHTYEPEPDQIHIRLLPWNADPRTEQFRLAHLTPSWRQQNRGPPGRAGTGPEGPSSTSTTAGDAAGSVPSAARDALLCCDSGLSGRPHPLLQTPAQPLLAKAFGQLLTNPIVCDYYTWYLWIMRWAPWPLPPTALFHFLPQDLGRAVAWCGGADHHPPPVPRPPIPRSLYHLLVRRAAQVMAKPLDAAPRHTVSPASVGVGRGVPPARRSPAPLPQRRSPSPFQAALTSVSRMSGKPPTQPPRVPVREPAESTPQTPHAKASGPKIDPYGWITSGRPWWGWQSYLLGQGLLPEEDLELDVTLAVGSAEPVQLGPTLGELVHILLAQVMAPNAIAIRLDNPFNPTFIRMNPTPNDIAPLDTLASDPDLAQPKLADPTSSYPFASYGPLYADVTSSQVGSAVTADFQSGKHPPEAGRDAPRRPAWPEYRNVPDKGARAPPAQSRDPPGTYQSMRPALESTATLIGDKIKDSIFVLKAHFRGKRQ